MQFTDEIYQTYARTVYKYLLSLTYDEEIAQELTQETFYQAVRCIGRYDESCSISTWLCAIAKNQLSVYRRKHPVLESMDGDNRDGLPVSSVSRNGAYDSVSSAEKNALDSENRVELMKKLHLCQEPFREILYLRIFGNLSFKEIGEIMGRTENWARVTFYRGKEKLRKEIMKDAE